MERRKVLGSLSKTDINTRGIGSMTRKMGTANRRAWKECTKETSLMARKMVRDSFRGRTGPATLASGRITCLMDEGLTFNQTEGNTRGNG